MNFPKGKVPSLFLLIERYVEDKMKYLELEIEIVVLEEGDVLTYSQEEEDIWGDWEEK